MIGPARLQDLLIQLESQPRNDPDNGLIRRVVRLRARDTCEYCLRRTVSPFHIDHIIPADLWKSYITGRIAGVPPIVGRRGPDHLDNYAWSCPLCNGSKLQRIAARVNGRNQRIFDPRYDYWPEHFVFMSRYLAITAITPIGLGGYLGLATEQILNLNGGGLNGPLVTRYEDIVSGRYPPEWAGGWVV